MDQINWYLWDGRLQAWSAVSAGEAARQLCVFGNLIRLMSSQEAYELSGF